MFVFLSIKETGFVAHLGSHSNHIKPKLKLSTKIQNTCEGRVDTDSPWFDKDCEKITLTLLLNNSSETLQSIKHVQQSSENIASKV